MANTKSKTIIIILLILAVLSIAGLVVMLIHENSSTKVPDFSGMTLMEATLYGQECDLTVKDGQMLDGDKDNKGKILEQLPAAGTDAKSGDVIIVKVSRGPGDGKTPNVINMSTDDAKKAIESAGFEVGSINQVAGVEKAGTVLAQNPKGNKELEKGKKISIEVSDGTMVYVPNLIGKSDVNAKQTLDSCGLKGEVYEISYSNSVAYGCVKKQNPGGGAMVKRGTTVYLWFSLGREEDADEHYYDSPPGQNLIN